MRGEGHGVSWHCRHGIDKDAFYSLLVKPRLPINDSFVNAVRHESIALRMAYYDIDAILTDAQVTSCRFHA